MTKTLENIKIGKLESAPYTNNLASMHVVIISNSQLLVSWIMLQKDWIDHIDSCKLYKSVIRFLPL